MAIRFGINTFLWTAHFEPEHLSLLPAIREHGYDGIEMFVFEPARVRAAEIRRGLDAHQLGCTFCTAFGPGISLAAPDAAVRRQARQHLADCIRVVAETGSQILAGPVYTPLGDKPGRRRTQDEWAYVIDELAQVTSVLDAHQVTLCVEPLNRFETYFLNTTGDACALIDAIRHPRVGIVLDTFHANIEDKNIAESIRSAGPRIRHLHLNENDRGTPGSGHIDWPGVFAAIREIEYNGWVTIESFGSRIQEIAAAACIWRDLAPTTEEIAWDGLRFLKGGLA
jgi:D-psicose/D-tagatose/L-ribulose 3-epimerase